jgi:hypothetical protein
VRILIHSFQLKKVDAKIGARMKAKQLLALLNATMDALTEAIKTLHSFISDNNKGIITYSKEVEIVEAYKENLRLPKWPYNLYSRFKDHYLKDYKKIFLELKGIVKEKIALF